jgi:raffinose/stachyose/melibiose transport system permease protein
MIVICLTVMSMVLALMLTANIRLKTFFRTMFFFPAVSFLMVIGLMWNAILYHIGPMIGGALNIKALQTNILGNAGLAQFGILLVNVW